MYFSSCFVDIVEGKLIYVFKNFTKTHAHTHNKIGENISLSLYCSLSLCCSLSLSLSPSLRVLLSIILMLVPQVATPSKFVGDATLIESFFDCASVCVYVRVWLCLLCVCLYACLSVVRICKTYELTIGSPDRSFRPTGS